MLEAFGTKTVISLTGVSRNQLDHWDRQGIVKPSVSAGRGKGSRKEYSFRDLVQIKVAKRLRDEGISLQKIRKALVYLRRHFPEVRSPLAELRFLTDGVSVFVLTEDPDIILDTLKGQFVFAFALGEMIQNLRTDIKGFAKPFEERVQVEGAYYTVVLVPDLEDGGYSIQCKELPAAISQGETTQEALDNVIDAIELCLETERDLQEAGAKAL